ncbi:TonB-dependent receptor [Flavihumibacter profundi]|uniref:TonB-dependent receptor n=1 Tax=Flavihumibacter profundi TaxID=2716883 RepID=UPI001CC58CA3|nr:TonB-dependent receptor [Flavihumibacter profundi]MBZ5856721.1 TonB-dependent receptor [Flavihumibacter profundi]
MNFLFFFMALLAVQLLAAQSRWIAGRVVQKGNSTAIPMATIACENGKLSVLSGPSGQFRIQLPDTTAQLIVSAVGYKNIAVPINSDSLIIELQPNLREMDEVVITGTMRAVQRSASPVPVEVYNQSFFRKNPTPSIFESLQLVNGVRPQLNCNVCNTGDIHINGLEGPYTMVLIDGMPIVSSLASVYGLQGIPNALVERIEIVKGPASSLYGSEAIGGLINVITRQPGKAPLISFEYSGSSWREHNFDLGMRLANRRKSQTLLGVNYFNFTHRYDKNLDNFTDVTLQNRVSLFGKTSFTRKFSRLAALAMRFIAEDRFGGEMQWTREFRATDSVYGEQISTTRGELIGNYQLPLIEKINFLFSANFHRQRSAYGKNLFNADQRIGFAEFTWEKKMGDEHQLLSGIVGRYTAYDDNTPATAGPNGSGNRPDNIFLPGIFLQDEITLNKRHLLLTGLRYDYDKRHGNIFTPRVAWKWSFSDMDYLRINAGSGFRVVNLFTEDHAALTGARKVEIKGNLKPEKSYNLNINYTRKLIFSKGYMNVEASGWYTYFSNRILPDYQTDPDKIIYANLDGFARSVGTSLNVEAAFKRLRFTAGFTLQDVSLATKNKSGETERYRQLLTEQWSGTWTLSYTVGNSGWSADYTGNIYGPMLLPLVSNLDPRSPVSPVWTIQNLQLTKKGKGMWEWFGGVKNLLNFTPLANNPFIIARAHDPFDKQVVRDSNGQVIPTTENPYALSFDPNYVYAPNQGRKFFIGFRYAINRKAGVE